MRCPRARYLLRSASGERSQPEQATSTNSATKPIARRIIVHSPFCVLCVAHEAECRTATPARSCASTARCSIPSHRLFRTATGLKYPTTDATLHLFSERDSAQQIPQTDRTAEIRGFSAKVRPNPNAIHKPPAGGPGLGPSLMGKDTIICRKYEYFVRHRRSVNPHRRNLVA